MIDTKCNVCNKEQAVTVAASPLGAISFAYCQTCLEEGLEPLGAFIGVGIKFEEFRPEMQGWVRKNLSYHDVTVEEFNAEVDEMLQEYEEYMKAEEAAARDEPDS